MVGYSVNRKDLLDRLRRIEGQVRGIQRMVQEDQYCIDVLTQVNSAAAALKAVGMGLLGSALGYLFGKDWPSDKPGRDTTPGASQPGQPQPPT